MAIDNRKVLRDIRLPERRDEKGAVTQERRTLTEADADVIQASFPQERIDAFVADGTLSGDWKSSQKASKGDAEKK